jgi:hypothetical protein
MQARRVLARRFRNSLVAALALAAIGSSTVTTAATASGEKPAAAAGGQPAPNPPGAQHFDVSPPLRDIAPAPAPPPDKKHEHPQHGVPVPASTGAPDPVVQTSPGLAAAPALGVGFEGVGAGFTGPAGTFSVTSAPPDTNGAVGPSHYVQIVNTSLAIFNKSGTAIYGPVPTNTVWSGFGGGCQSNDDGDATVDYDRLANRWIISQFSVSTTPYLQCVAVSTSGDPTGSYYRYSFQYNDFPDYPKLGVWPDAYYTTFNLFRNGTTFAGPEICAYDRAKMLLGQAATQQCFTLSTAYGGLLPADLDSSTAPPSGSPNYVLSFGTNSLQLWKFHVDWTTPANSALTGPTTIPVAAFSPACSGGTCIPQSGTTQKLDSLADRLMYRLAYRNLGDHESLVVDHSVTAGSSVGVRWYELRSPNGTPTVYQQGTYAPDSTYRWMGSAAMDKNGDIALGFSTSSGSLHPGIHYTGRLATDPLGTMTQGEGVLFDGAGSQTGGLSRWGDYSSLSVDPSDDCTFWYTNEYLASNGSFNWHTRIGSFKLPGCGTTGPSDFSISASPSSVSVAQGGSGTSTISTAVTSGSAQTVSLSASGQPAGTTVSFNPASVTAGGSSTMTVNVGSSTAAGSYTITVTGTGSSATHSTSVGLTVTTVGALVNGGFESGNLSGWTAGGLVVPQVVTTAHTGSYAAKLGSTTAFNGNSTLTQTITIPSGHSRLTFWYQPHCPDTLTYDQIQMQIRNTAGSTLATVLNVCSNSGSWTSVSYDTSAYAGQTVVLWFNGHDDGYASDPTYSFLDDVAVSTYTPSANVVQNPGFETGTLGSWSASGAFTPVISTSGHSGSYSARVGSTNPVNGNSTLTQTVTVPAGTSTLTFWYQPHCTDTITYDQIQMQVRNASGSTLATVLNACSNSGAWTQASLNMSPYAGQTVVLWFNDHDDGYAGDPTYFLLDDVSLS